MSRLENELSNCYVPSRQDLTSRVADIGTALQLHLATAIFKLHNDMDTLFSFVALLEFLCAVCVVVVVIARPTLHASGVLCFRFIVGAGAFLSLAALACKTVSLVIKYTHSEGHLRAVLAAIRCRAELVLVQMEEPS